MPSIYINMLSQSDFMRHKLPRTEEDSKPHPTKNQIENLKPWPGVRGLRSWAHLHTGVRVWPTAEGSDCLSRFCDCWLGHWRTCPGLCSPLSRRSCKPPSSPWTLVFYRTSRAFIFFFHGMKKWLDPFFILRQKIYPWKTLEQKENNGAKRHWAVGNF